MAAQTSTGGIAFNFKSRESATPKPAPDRRFDLLLMGAFSGTQHREGLPALAARQLLRIDRDNLDTVMARLKPTINIAREGQGNLLLTFSELDDFHPDSLYQRLPFFADLHALRRGLQSDSGFARAAEELESLLNLTPPAADAPGATAPGTAAPSPAPSPDGLLDAILDDQQPDQPTASDQWLSQLVDAAAAPYSQPVADPRKEDYLARLDALLSHLMTSILHHPDFQAVESLWRSVAFLTQQLETDQHLTLTLVDIAQEELFADLAAHNPVENSQFNRLITTADAGSTAPRWHAVVGLYQFLPDKLDALMLGLIAKLCEHAQTPFLSDAHSLLAQAQHWFLNGDPDNWQEPASTAFTHTWEQVRALPSAAYVALAAPRLLLRAPYSDRGRSIEHFRFEELAGAVQANQLLWGCGAIALTTLLANRFSEQRTATSDKPAIVERLPLAFYTDSDDDSRQPVPCAECYLTQRGYDQLRAIGLSPLVSLRDRDAIRVPGVFSLHLDGGPLRLR